MPTLTPAGLVQVQVARSGDTRAVVGVPSLGLLAVARGRAVELVDTRTWRPLRFLVSPGGALVSLATVTMADSTVLVAAGGTDGAIKLWDAATGGCQGVLEAGPDPVRALAGVPLPHGRPGLVAVTGRRVLVWDATDRTRLADLGPALPTQTPRPTAPEVLAVHALGPDLLALGRRDGSIGLWDPTTGHPAAAPLVGHTGPVLTLTHVDLPDRRLLASGGQDGTVRLWDTSQGAATGRPLRGHESWVRALTTLTLADGRVLLASAGDDEAVLLWDPATGRRHGEALTGHGASVASLTAVAGPGPGQVLASAGDDDTVLLWDPAGEHPHEPVPPCPVVTRSDWPMALAAVPGRGLLAVGGTDPGVRVWDVGSGTPLGRPLLGPGAPVRMLGTVRDPDGDHLVVAADGDGLVQVWDPVTATPRGAAFDSRTSLTGALTVLTDPQGRPVLAGAGGGGTVHLWDPLTGRESGRLVPGHTGRILAITAVTLFGGHSVVATSGEDETVRLTGTPDGHPAERWLQPGEQILAMAAPEGCAMLAGAGAAGHVFIWNAVTLELVGTPLTGHVGAVTALTTGMVAGLPLVMSGGEDGTVRVWNSVAGTQLGGALIGHTDSVLALALVEGPAGRTVLASTGYDGTVRLWDPVTGEALAVLVAGRGIDDWAAVSADGTRYRTGGGDLLWWAAGTRRLGPGDVHEPEVRRLGPDEPLVTGRD